MGLSAPRSRLTMFDDIAHFACIGLVRGAGRTIPLPMVISLLEHPISLLPTIGASLTQQVIYETTQSFHSNYKHIGAYYETREL